MRRASGGMLVLPWLGADVNVKEEEVKHFYGLEEGGREDRKGDQG